MIKSIHILRAFAAWTVVVHHFMQLLEPDAGAVGHFFLEHGGIGVDVFFIISGFVMHYSFATRSKPAMTFLAHRLIRIVPAYWIATLVLVLCTLVGVVPAEHIFTQWDFATLCQSLLFIPHEHPSGVGVFPVLTVGWTLNFEMFFYVLVGLCIALVPKRPFDVACLMLLVLPIIVDADRAFASVMSSLLLWEFIVGILVSAVYQAGVFQALSGQLRATLGASLLVSGMVYVGLEGPKYGLLASSMFVVGFLLIDTRLQYGSRLMNALKKLGDLSYSSYLYHQLALLFLLKVFGQPDTAFMTIALLFVTFGLTYGLSLLSHDLIEKKVGSSLRSYRTWRMPVVFTPKR